MSPVDYGGKQKKESTKSFSHNEREDSEIKANVHSIRSPIKGIPVGNFVLILRSPHIPTGVAVLWSPPPTGPGTQSAFGKQVHNCPAAFCYPPVSANEAQHLLYAKHITKG